MSSSELIAVFAVAMLGIAVVSIAVDWIGKPIRRRFIPRMYRYPHELPRQVDPSRTEWSDTEFVIPAGPGKGEPHRYDDGSTEWSEAEFHVPEASPTLTAGSADLPVVMPVGELPAEPGEPDELAAVAADTGDVGSTGGFAPVDDIATGPERAVGWRPGQYIYNLTGDGLEPDADTVGSRFWQNIAATEHADAFGATNRQRMAAGAGPQRLNRRNGAVETMHLPIEGYEAAKGRAPTPRWPDAEPDPFASTA